MDYSSRIGSPCEEFIYPLKYNGKEYSNYKLSNQGYIQNINTGRCLNVYSYGHNLQCRIYDKGKWTTVYLARAVLENFKNVSFDPKNNYKIYFKDEDLTNCSIDNLIYKPFDPQKPNEYNYVLHGDYGEVQICGYTVLLDTEFILNELSKYKFWPKKAKSGACYFLSTGMEQHSKSLHQLVVQYYRPEYEYYDRVIDHINRNELDCRNSNLRCVTAGLNSINRSGKSYTKRKSGYRTEVRIGKETIGKSFFYSDFETEEKCFEAVQSYLKNVIEPLKDNNFNDELKKSYKYDIIRSFHYYIDNNNLELLNNILRENFGLELNKIDGQNQ